MQQLFGIGYKGKIIAVGTPEDLKQMDLVREKGQHSLLTPIAEIALEPFTPQLCSIAAQNHEEQKFIPRYSLESIYADPNIYGPNKYGPFGDVLFVTVLNKVGSQIPVLLTNIAPKAFHKPALAADLVVIVDDGVDDPYFVGIRRKNEPGIGQPATIGGFLDVKGYHLDSPLETVLHEGPEEASVSIFQKDGTPLTENSLLSSKVHEVSVILPNTGSFALSGQLKYIGIFPTGPQEELPSGQKRVHWTFGYVLYITAHRTFLDETSVANMFHADDDAESMYVKKLSGKLEDLPPFYSAHHRDLCIAALNELRSSCDY